MENLDFEEAKQPIHYTYPITGWRDKLMGYGTETIGEYDALGNPHKYRNKTLDWSHGRQLDKFGDIATFEYNASGIRTSKTFFTNAGCNCDADCNCDEYFTTKFLLNGTKIIRQQDCCNTLDFFYGADGITGFHITSQNATYNGTSLNHDFYYKKNIQGDIIGIIDNTGTEIVKYVYDAWGNHKAFDANGEMLDISALDSYTNTGNIVQFIANKNPFRYRGYYYDFETGLYYLNSRYYDPETGRFINADDVSVLEATQNNVNGLNIYVYCLNNPVNDIDVNGDLSWCQKLLLGLALIFVGALVTALTAGAGIGFFAAFGSALLTSTIQTGISVAISAGIGMIIGGITTGTWEGALNGLVNGAIDGFMWGGILAGGSQILSGAMKVARIVHGPGKMGINLFNDKLRILSPDKAHFKIPGGTLIKFGKFSLDTGRYALHMHIRLGYLMDKHLMVIPLITSIIELFKKRS